MGFLTAPLYLFSEFFIGKATEHLIGEGVKAEYLNDSRLGRVLDQLYEYGVSILFLKIASVMAKCFSLKISSAHIDGTSISVEGKYLQPEEEKIEPYSTDSTPKLDEDDSEPVPITITPFGRLRPHGYSRDHRPDLKQFTLKSVNNWRRRNSLIYAGGFWQ
jgi:transposase